MKKLVAAIAIPSLLVSTYLLGLVAPSFAQSQSKWQAVSTNDVGDRFFLDQSSVIKRGNIAYFRDMVIYGAPKNGLSGMASYKSANCATGQYRAREITTFDLNKRVRDSFVDGDRAPLNQAKPGSSLATVLRSACSR